MVHEAIAELDVKLMTYEDAAKQSIQFMETKEEERRQAEEEMRNRQARSSNCKISGLNEVEKENTSEVVTSFLTDQLKVHDPKVVHAFRIGQKKGDLPRPILVKFCTDQEKERVKANRGMLKGHKVWLHDDLTPTQVKLRKVELDKVKAAKEEGWVAYLRNGQAVITQKKRSLSK